MSSYKINFSNKSIEFDSQTISFEQYGVHIIQGENGVGKTTIAKKIIFNNIKNNEEYHDIFSYIEQDPPQYNCKMEHYISRFNKSISSEDMHKMLDFFDIANLDFNENVSKFSGGEKTKLNIISGFLKDSDTIFLDEPTNNLDEISIKGLLNIIEMYKDKKCIIIITHDKRIEQHFKNKIIIAPNSISQNFDVMNNNVVKNNEKIKYPFFKIFFSQLKKPVNLFHWIFIYSLILCFFVINVIILLTTYSFELLPQKDDTLVVYNIDYYYNDFNYTYIKEALNNVEIDENLYSKLITYDDLDEITSLNSIDSIYISDDEYIEDLHIKQVKNTLDNEINLFSLPKSAIANYDSQISYNFDFRRIYEGRLPDDFKNEVVISENLLEKFFPSIPIDDPINKKIIINNIEYTIVGVGYYDICLVSLDSNENFGFFEYNSSCSEIIDKNIQFKIENNFIFYDIPLNIIINNNDGKAKETLETLIVSFPAANYISYDFMYLTQLYTNHRSLNFILTINLWFSISLSSCMFFLNIKKIKINKNIINFYDNYYISKFKTTLTMMSTYIFNSICLYFFVITLLKVFNLSILQISILSNILIMDLFIIISPLLLSFLIYVRKRWIQ